MKVEIPTICELMKSLPGRISGETRDKVEQAYLWEVYTCINYARMAEENGGEARVIMDIFKGNSAFFSVYDYSKDKKDEYNWHGQNTSQWVYAGCIQVSKDGNVSRHH